MGSKGNNGTNINNGKAQVPNWAGIHPVDEAVPPRISSLSTENHQLLSQVVNAEIVPRLAGSKTSNAAHSQPDEQAKTCRPCADERIHFKSLLLQGDTFDCIAFIEKVRSRGVTLSNIYLELFAPVANELGNQWKADSLSFLDVTRAVGKLQSLVHAIDYDQPTSRPIEPGHRIVFSSAPDEQHVLGILIICRLFEMEGWDVAGGAGFQAGDELTDLVQNEWFGVVGFSASTEQRALRLKQTITDLRESSLNKSISVLVGGTVFAHNPEICTEIGADAVALDVSDAIAKAEMLLPQSATPPDL
jgi:methanogenic corrinoid protein MtbC1